MRLKLFKFFRKKYFSKISKIFQDSIARATIIVDMDKSEGSKNKTMALYNQSEASSNQTIIIDQSETSTDFDQSESSNKTATETSKTQRFLNPDIERLGF